jgi:hypothetical protein
MTLRRNHHFVIGCPEFAIIGGKVGECRAARFDASPPMYIHCAYAVFLGRKQAALKPEGPWFGLRRCAQSASKGRDNVANPRDLISKGDEK